MHIVGLARKISFIPLKLGVTAILSAASLSHAADYYWNGIIDSSFTTPGNWWEDIDATLAGVVPGATDRAIFNANNFATAPLSFGASRSLGGMVFNANASSPMIFGATVNDFVLSLGSMGIDVQNGSGAHLINSGVTLTASQTWNNSSSNPFTIAGNFITGANALTITGSQDFIISGASSINGAATLNHTGSGELKLSGAINLTNNLTISGTGDTTLQGGTIQLTGGNRTFFVENTGNVIFGNIDTSDGTARAITFDVAEGASPIVNGVISDTGAVIKSGKGTLTLNGANSFSSVGNGLRINDGKVIVNTANSNNPRINMGGVAGGSPILELNATYRTENIVYDATNNSNGAIINGTGAISLNGNRTLTVGDSTNANTDLTIMVPITNGDSTGRALTKSGAGTVYMGGINTFTGTFTIQNGTVIQGASQSAAGSLTLGGAATGTPILSIESGVVFRLGGTLTYSATNNPNAALINGEGSLGLFGNRSFNIGDSSNAVNELTIQTAITDGDATARNVTKSGAGNLVMQGANTYGGSTSVFNGGLILDYSLNNGDNKLSNTADVAMQGGRLELQSNSDSSTTETAGNMTVSSGSNTVALVSNGGQSMNFDLAGLTRSTGAGLINFQINNSGLVTVTAATGAANNTNGFLGGWATYNGNRWAMRSASNQIVAYAGHVKNDLGSWTSNDDIIIDSATTGTLSTPVISSLILDTSSPTTLNIDNHAKALGLTSNAIMASSSLGGNDVTLQASQLVGLFTGTGGTVEMIIRNEGMGTFTVDANLGATNAPITSALNIVYGGEGILKLSGVNSNLGSTTINGDVVVSGGSALADYSSVILGSAGSSLNLDGSSETIGSLSSPTSQTAQINLGTDGSLTINQRSAGTYNGSFTGSGTITKEGNATLSLATSSHAGFTGSVEVLGGPWIYPWIPMVFQQSAVCCCVAAHF